MAAAAFYVWGVGPAASSLVREGEAAEDWPADAVATTSEDEGWCVVVVAHEETLDECTRHDPAVLGWTLVASERSRSCATSR